MSGSWSGNVLSITKNTTGSNSLSYTVVAAASISYDASTHKYTATAKASGGGVVRDTKTTTGGTEAYNAGWNDCIDALHLISDGSGGYYCYNSYNDAYLYAVASDYANGQWYKVVSNSNKSATINKK